MSYVLINGKRYYKDDRTGRTTLDNVSQAEAERRAQRNPGIPRTTWTSPPRTTRTNQLQSTASSVRTSSHAGVPWKAVIACAVVVLFIAAFFHNRSHISPEEQAINYYMNGQQAAAEEADAVSAGNDQGAGSGDEGAASEEVTASAAYLMPHSADRYLEPSDIQGYSSDEIQLMINEIYARHGREFHSQEYVDYFSAKDWYDPVPGKSDEAIVSEFNEFEKANVRLLSKYV